MYSVRDPSADDVPASRQVKQLGEGPSPSSMRVEIREQPESICSKQSDRIVSLPR